MTKKLYPVDFMFSQRCITRGYALPASSPEEAREKARQCITPDGYFDMDKYIELGGETRGLFWDTLYSVENSYEFDEDSFDPDEAMEIEEETK